MTFRRSLGWSLVIQSVGAMCTALVSVFISRRFGPVPQGSFASMRSWVDLTTQIAVFGFPQALIYALSAGAVPANSIRTFVALYSAAILVVSGVAGLVIGHMQVLLAIAAAASAIQNLCRPVVLNDRSSVSFNVISILPSVLLAAFALIIPRGGNIWMAAILLISFVLGAAASVGMVGLRRLLHPFAPPSGKAVKALFEYSMWSGLIVVLVQGTIVGTYESLRGLSNGPLMIGLFSIPILLANAAALPLNMVGPLLFQRWARDYGQSQAGASVISALHITGLAACVGTPIFLLMIWKAIPVVFGSKFAGSVGPCLVMGVGAYFFLQSKVQAFVLLSISVPRSYAVCSVFRTLAIFAALWSGLRTHLLGVACAWLSGDVVFTFLAARLIADRLNVPIIAGLGLDPSHLRAAREVLRGMAGGPFRNLKTGEPAGTIVP